MFVKNLLRMHIKEKGGKRNGSVKEKRKPGWVYMTVNSWCE
jgi:hypothetical protein